MHAIARVPACRLHDNSVDQKRRPPKSRWPLPSKNRFFIGRAARKDSAVHVSLSSDSPVKQPGTEAVPPPGEPESCRSLKPPTGSEAFLPLIVRSFEGAQSRRNADGAPYLRYIGVRPDKCQHIMPEILASVAQEPVQNRLLLYRFAASSNRVGGKPNAALRPHFSAVLDQSVGGCSDRG